jgi:hypothetical protein
MFPAATTWDYASRLGKLASEAGIALSTHAPIAAILGYRERARSCGWP